MAKTKIEWMQVIIAIIIGVAISWYMFRQECSTVSEAIGQNICQKMGGFIGFSASGPCELYITCNAGQIRLIDTSCT